MSLPYSVHRRGPWWNAQDTRGDLPSMTALALVERNQPRFSTGNHSVLTYENETLVQRLQVKEGIRKEESEVLFLDMRKFLLLCGTTTTPLSPPEKIDMAWHHFILFTKDYREFCLRYFDRFIGHGPVSRDMPEQAIPAVSRTVALATATFGDLLSTNWLNQPKADCGGSTNCGGKTCCNDGGG